MLQIMWALQVHQLVMVGLSPAFFAMAFYEAIVHIVLRFPQFLDSATPPVEQLRWARSPIVLAFSYYMCYVLWVLVAYFLGE